RAAPALRGRDLGGARLDRPDSASPRLPARVQTRVRTATARPVPGARISLRDGLGDVHAGATADRSGVAVCEVPISRVTASGRAVLTPVAVVVSANGYTSTRTAIAGPAPTAITVTLASSGRRSPPSGLTPGGARPQHRTPSSTPAQQPR